MTQIFPFLIISPYYLQHFRVVFRVKADEHLAIMTHFITSNSKLKPKKNTWTYHIWALLERTKTTQTNFGKHEIEVYFDFLVWSIPHLLTRRERCLYGYDCHQPAMSSLVGEKGFHFSFHSNLADVIHFIYFLFQTNVYAKILKESC